MIAPQIDNDIVISTVTRSIIFLTVLISLSSLVPKYFQIGSCSEAFLKSCRFPGWPTLFPPLGVIYYLVRFGKDGIRFFDEYIAEHGSFSRIVGKIYVVSDADAIKKILRSTEPSHIHKTKLAGIVFKLAGIQDGLIAAGPAVWAKHRKLLSPCFSYKALQNYLGTVDKNARNLVGELLDMRSSAVGKYDLLEILDLHMIKTISSIVMGADFASDEENSRFRLDFQRGKGLCMYRAYRPWLVNDIIWRFHPRFKEFKESVGGVREFVQRLIQKFRHEIQSEGKTDGDEGVGIKAHRPMILEMLLSGEMTEEEIVTEVLTFLIAGHESTTTQINFLLFLLALNPEEQRKCQREIDEVYVQVGEAGALSLENLGNLKYLGKCIIESLRLTPVFPLIMRRIEYPLRIDSLREIPGGSDILIPIWNVHRNPKYYKNPLAFRPDRFTHDNEGNQALLSFSIGSRECIGRKLALMEMKVFLFWLLKTFDIRTTDKLENVKFLFHGSLKPEKVIDLKLIKRA